MSPPDRLPRDWRSALAIVALTIAGIAGARSWVISIAEAQDAPQREVLNRIQPMVEEMYLACVADKRCDGKALRVK